MTLKSIFLPVAAGGALILPTWADPATHLIQAPAAEAKEAPASSLAVPAALAQKLGFAAHAPKNAEGYFSILGAYDMYERLLATELGKFLVEAAAEQGEDLKETEKSEEFRMLKAIVGEEIFAVFGDKSGQQAVNLQALNKSSNFYQMKMMVAAAAAATKGESDPSEMQGLMMDMFSSILGDPKSGIAVFEKSEMPPITLGFKVSDDAMREQISMTMIGGVQSLLEMGEQIPVDELEMNKAGVDLAGITINGKKLANLADEDQRLKMAEVFGSRAIVDRFLAAVAKKNLHVAIGVKESYIILHLGASMDAFQLAEKPADSLLANQGMDFLKNYANKDLRLLVFGEDEALKTMSKDGEVFSSMARGIKEGLAEADAFGDTRDIQALLSHVSAVEGQLFGMIDYSRLGTVGFIENGFKLEGHGGSNLAHLNHETPHTFTSLGDLEDVLFFTNSRANPAFNGKVYEMMDSLGEAAYLMAGRVAKLNFDDGDFRDFKEGFKMYDEVAAADLRTMWEALSGDWAEGTGDEGALVIDLKGTLPTVPEVPRVIVKEGRMLRLAFVTPMTDRAKMASAWTKIEGSIENLLETVEKMDGPTIPMQEIDENMKDGVTYFTTAIQFTTKDARPVVALTDNHFYLGTSQKFIADLDAKLKAEAKAPARVGSYTRLDLQAAQKFASYWLKLVKDNADEVFENEYQRDDFNENLPMIEKFIAAAGELKEVEGYTRLENGEARSSLHFNMK